MICLLVPWAFAAPQGFLATEVATQEVSVWTGVTWTVSRVAALGPAATLSDRGAVVELLVPLEFGAFGVLPSLGAGWDLAAEDWRVQGRLDAVFEVANLEKANFSIDHRLRFVADASLKPDTLAIREAILSRIKGVTTGPAWEFRRTGSAMAVTQCAPGWTVRFGTEAVAAGVFLGWDFVKEPAGVWGPVAGRTEAVLRF